MSNLLTPLATVAIGALIGLTGVGGVFLVPWLVLVEGRSVHETIGTILVCFMLSQSVGTALYARRGAIDWRTTLWVCVGTLPFGPLGARLSANLPADAIKVIIAGFLLIAGGRVIYDTLHPPPGSRASAKGPRLPAALLLSCGAVVGFLAGLMGVGGPVLLVPLLLLLGVPVATTVGLSQVVGLFGSITGAVGHVLFGLIDWGLALALAACTIVGIWLGARLNRHVPPAPLRLTVGTLCLLVAPLILLGPSP